MRRNIQKQLFSRSRQRLARCFSLLFLSGVFLCPFFFPFIYFFDYARFFLFFSNFVFSTALSFLYAWIRVQKNILQYVCIFNCPLLRCYLDILSSFHSHVVFVLYLLAALGWSFQLLFFSIFFCASMHVLCGLQSDFLLLHLPFDTNWVAVYTIRSFAVCCCIPAFIFRKMEHCFSLLFNVFILMYSCCIVSIRVDLCILVLFCRIFCRHHFLLSLLSPFSYFIFKFIVSCWILSLLTHV